MLHGGSGLPATVPSGNALGVTNGLGPVNLLGLNHAASWPLTGPLNAQTAAAAAAACAAAGMPGVALNAAGMGVTPAPFGRLGMMGLAADSMTAALAAGPMGAAVPCPGPTAALPGLLGLTPMAPFGAANMMLNGLARNGSVDGSVCG